jgi:hypothetical protein
MGGWKTIQIKTYSFYPNNFPTPVGFYPNNFPTPVGFYPNNFSTPLERFT